MMSIFALIRPYRDPEDHLYSQVDLGGDFSDLLYNTQQLYKAAKFSGATLERIPGCFGVWVTKEQKTRLFFETYSSGTDYSSDLLMNEKTESKKLLHFLSIRTPLGIEISLSEDTKESCCALAKNIGYPVVLKPADDGMGNGVFAGIANEGQLRATIEIILSQLPYRNMLLERHVPGSEYRLFTTKEGFFAAVKRTPASVTGDGVSSIRELAELENIRRLEPRTTCLCSIKLDAIAESYLEQSGLNFESVIPAGQVVTLRAASNVSMGGFCEDVTDLVHPTARQLARTIIEELPTTDVVGIDLICQDVSDDLHFQDYAVIELNTCPGLSLHTVPAVGVSRDTPGALFQAIWTAC